MHCVPNCTRGYDNFVGSEVFNTIKMEESPVLTSLATDRGGLLLLLIKRRFRTILLNFALVRLARNLYSCNVENVHVHQIQK